MIRRALAQLAAFVGLRPPITMVPCWCGRTHPLGFWHDSTHGRVDRDIQEQARDLLGIPLNATRASGAAWDWARLTAIEETLQTRRDAERKARR